MNTDVLDTKSSVKVVGSNGQISLGKEFAGRQVLVEEREPGVWLIRTALVVPENELWLQLPKAKQDLQRAMSRALNTSPSESDPDEILRKFEHGQKTKPRASRHK